MTAGSPANAPPSPPSPPSSSPSASPPASASTGPLDTGTWRWARACATWTFERRISAAGPAAAIAAAARAAIVASPGFARPAAATWTTASAGDDAATQPRGTPIDADTPSTVLHAHPDLIAGALDLDLVVQAPDGSEAILDAAAALHIEIDDDRLVFWLSLHVDVYARRSFAANRDNTALAERNAPRLAGFLARLAEATGADVASVDAPGYDVTPDGFA
jgi:hypothetical protein